MGYLKAALPGPEGPEGPPGPPGPAGGGELTIGPRLRAADTGPLDVAAQATIGRVPVAGTVASVWMLFEGSGFLADDTDYAGWTFYIFDATGGLVSICASATTQTIGAGGIGNVTAYASYEATLAAPGDLVLAAGDSVVIEEAKAGSGIEIPATLFAFTYST